MVGKVDPTPAGPGKPKSLVERPPIENPQPIPTSVRHLFHPKAGEAGKTAKPAHPAAPKPSFVNKAAPGVTKTQASKSEQASPTKPEPAPKSDAEGVAEKK